MRFLLIIFFLDSYFSFCQSNVKVRFQPLFKGQEIALNTVYQLDSAATIEFNTLRFYISDLYFSDTQGQELMGKPYHLVDLEDSTSLLLFEHNEPLVNLRFLLGTDSLTNVSGNLEGPLDPINGMYWAWNSGYINFKLEGKSSLSGAKDKSFEFHIGGYLPPFQTVQELNFNVNAQSKNVTIALNIDEWLNKIDLSNSFSMMIPGEKATQLAKELVPIFKIKTDDK